MSLYIFLLLLLPVLVWWNCPLFVPRRRCTWFQKLGNNPSLDSCISNYFATFTTKLESGVSPSMGIFTSVFSLGHVSLLRNQLWKCSDKRTVTFPKSFNLTFVAGIYLLRAGRIPEFSCNALDVASLNPVSSLLSFYAFSLLSVPLRKGRCSAQPTSSEGRDPRSAASAGHTRHWPSPGTARQELSAPRSRPVAFSWRFA